MIETEFVLAVLELSSRVAMIQTCIPKLPCLYLPSTGF